MPNYAADFIAQRGKRTDLELTWELAEALNEAIEDEHELSAPELLAWHVCSVAQCDGIAEILENQPESIPITAKFARERGLLETANTLDNVAKGIGADDPVSMSTKIGGQSVDIPIDHTKWGAADLLLSLGDEDLDAAILDFVAANTEKITIPPPASVIKKAKQKKKVSKQGSNKTAAQLLQEVLAHKSPALRCELHQSDNARASGRTIDVSVRHEAQAALAAGELATFKKRYGVAASALLDMYEVHDGAVLFVVDGEAAFYLVPSAQWAENMAHVLTWVEMRWQDDPDEMPSYPKTAIPFGYIPGDPERWLLITEGKYAGMVMLSDSDVCDDEPRFSSMAEFMATMIVEPKRVLGCGGYTCYDKDGRSANGGDDCYYPVKYLFSK